MHSNAMVGGIVAALAGATIGCTALSPPVMSSHYGAAGRLRAGEIEASGSGNYFGSGGPAFSYAPTDNIAIEAGSELRQAGDDAQWALGYAGVRTTLTGREKERDGGPGAGPAADVAVGFGLGEGGVDDRGTPTLAVHDIAGGAYLQIGGAWHLARLFALFARTNLEASRASTLPVTFWWSHVAGPELTIGPASIYAVTGVAGFVNRETEPGAAWLPIEVGAALRFDVSRGLPRGVGDDDARNEPRLSASR